MTALSRFLTSSACYPPFPSNPCTPALCPSGPLSLHALPLCLSVPLPADIFKDTYEAPPVELDPEIEMFDLVDPGAAAAALEEEAIVIDD